MNLALAHFAANTGLEGPWHSSCFNAPAAIFAASDNPMNKSLRNAAWTTVLMLAGMSASQAALIDRGGGLIYDDVLNVTWLQDASYAETSGYAEYGNLSWNEAVNWASNLSYYDSVRGVTYDDWRLPSTVNDPSSLGYDTTGLSSELSYMYFINLGYAPEYSHDRYAPAPSSSNYNPFINLSTRAYWSGTLSDRGDRAWLVHYHFGSQETNSLYDGLKVWALRDGDVAGMISNPSVPEPGTMGLFAATLAIGAVVRRRRNRA